MLASSATSAPSHLTLPLPSSPDGASSISPNSASWRAPYPNDEHPQPFKVQVRLSSLQNHTLFPPAKMVVRRNANWSFPPAYLNHQSQSKVINHLHTSSHPSGVIQPKLNNVDCNCTFRNATVNGNEDREVALNFTNDVAGDESRNSTGSHRSQDSGFSDSGETQRGKNTTGEKSKGDHETNSKYLEQMYEAVEAENAPHCGTNTENPSRHACSMGSSVCRVVEVSRRHSSNVENIYHDLQYSGAAQSQKYHVPFIRDWKHVEGNMPSPILQLGYGCGQLTNSRRVSPLAEASNTHEFNHKVYDSTRNPSPTSRRQYLAQASRLSGDENLDSGSLNLAPASCSHTFDGYSCSAMNQQKRLKALFDKNCTLGSSASRTMSALQLPLLSSTPKRVSGEMVTTFSGQENSRIVVRDNFESLNKNINRSNNRRSNFNITDKKKSESLPYNTSITVQSYLKKKDAREVSSSKCSRSLSASKICNPVSTMSSKSPSTIRIESNTETTCPTLPSRIPPSISHQPDEIMCKCDQDQNYPPFPTSEFVSTGKSDNSLVTPANMATVLYNSHTPNGINPDLKTSRITLHSSNNSASFHNSCPDKTFTTSTTMPSRKVVEDQARDNVIRLWLHDLRSQTEPECLHSLQAKRIFQDDDEDKSEPEEIVSSRSDLRPVPSYVVTTVMLATTSVADTTTSVVVSSTSHRERVSSLRYNTNFPTSSNNLDPSLMNPKRFASDPITSNHVRQQRLLPPPMATAIQAISTPLRSIRNAETTAEIISGEFSKICKHLEFGIVTQVPPLVISLVGTIRSFLRGNHRLPTEGRPDVTDNAGSTFSGNLKKLEVSLENTCSLLSDAAKSIHVNVSLMHNAPADNHLKGHIDPLPVPLSSSTSSSSSMTSSPDSLQPSTWPPTDAQGDHEYQAAVEEIIMGMVTVGNLFSQVVDMRLTRDLRRIVKIIETGGFLRRVALHSLATVLADGGNHICRLAADIRAVRGVLGVLLTTTEDQERILALRCIATALCVGKAVKDFDKAGGFEIIAELLLNPSYSMRIKAEAVAVLTQATDPWIDLESTLLFLGIHLEKLIKALTVLIERFKSEEESFLLVVAAISNLTFLETASTTYLRDCRTVSYLIDVVQQEDRQFSVFVLDHVATILANMAGVESCRHEILQCGGIDILLQFLQRRPCLSPGKMDSTSVITACERLQQKSTIAITRLANEDGVARYVLEKGGVHRLITLCRKEKERNCSDGVLIAALATLRKLVAICGQDAIRSLRGAEDLIEPKLLDSFLLYSSRQESYV